MLHKQGQFWFDSVYNTCFRLVKQAGSLSRFPRGFSTCCSDPLFGSMCCSGNLRWLTSRGKPCWSTGLFAVGSAMLRLWHGLGLFRWLVSVGVKARVQRTGFQVILERRAMKGRSKSKRERNTVAPRFKLSDFGPSHRRLVESEYPYGAEPRPCP